MSTLVTGFDHPAVEAISAINSALDAPADARLWALPAEQLGQLMI